MRIARIKIWVDSQGRWERALGGNAILKRCVLSLERNFGKEDEFRVSRGSVAVHCWKGSSLCLGRVAVYGGER